MKGYIDGDELARAKMLVNEIDDFMNSIRNEVNQKRAYTRYLDEKLSGMIFDVKCLKSIVDDN